MSQSKFRCEWASASAQAGRHAGRGVRMRGRETAKARDTVPAISNLGAHQPLLRMAGRRVLVFPKLTQHHQGYITHCSADRRTPTIAHHHMHGSALPCLRYPVYGTSERYLELII